MIPQKYRNCTPVVNISTLRYAGCIPLGIDIRNYFWMESGLSMGIPRIDLKR